MHKWKVCFRSDGHCQCSRPRSTLSMLGCHVVIHAFHSNRIQSVTLNRQSHHNKSHRWISWIQFERDWMTDTIVYEMNNFIEIFRVHFMEEKRSNFRISDLSFYCKFHATSNAGYKSRICSNRLQIFIFVQSELVPNEAVKWGDAFQNREKRCRD